MSENALATDAIAEHDRVVTVAGVEIACRFTQPSGHPKGAILILPGSLVSDVDGNYPSMNLRPHVYADLAHQLAVHGYAVLRMAKIGPGAGSRTLDREAAARHYDFTTRVDVAVAGLELLRSSAQSKPVIVAGHSEGAVVASLLALTAAGEDIDGVVSLSGPALPILSILREQVAAMAGPGMSPDMSTFDQAAAAVRAGVALPAEAKTDPRTAMLASMPDVALAYLRSVDRVDPVATLAAVRQPVLIVQGGRDDSVVPHHAEWLRKARGDLSTKSVFFPSLTHFYKVAQPHHTPMQSMAIDTESDPAVSEAIANWVSSLQPESELKGLGLVSGKRGL